MARRLRGEYPGAIYPVPGIIPPAGAEAAQLEQMHMKLTPFPVVIQFARVPGRVSHVLTAGPNELRHPFHRSFPVLTGNYFSAA